MVEDSPEEYIYEMFNASPFKAILSALILGRQRECRNLREELKTIS